MSLLDDIRARSMAVAGDEINTAERDRAYLLDLVDRAVPYMEQAVLSNTVGSRQWLRDVRGEAT